MDKEWWIGMFLPGLLCVVIIAVFIWVIVTHGEGGRLIWTDGIPAFGGPR